MTMAMFATSLQQTLAAFSPLPSSLYFPQEPERKSPECILFTEEASTTEHA
jgi:hypothetical protein